MDKQKFLDSLLGLISIESVALTDVSAEYPYGTAPAKALDYVLALCAELGIRTVNRDGRIAWAEIGEGDEIVGILAHLDVVPVGDGWQHDPKGEICGDRLYGRGAVDDKGPLLAALFAMKELQDSGRPLSRRVRLIFGQCEEVGEWEDMQYYVNNEELPVFGFTPDADFPAIYGEKGILHYELRMPREKSGLVEVSGGDAANMVPGWAKATFIDELGRPVSLSCEGKNAHASLPEQGCNAIGRLMAMLEALGTDAPLVKFWNEHLGMDYDGKQMGCAFTDEQSGALTLNAGVIRTEGDTVSMLLDIRNPVTNTESAVRAAIEKACAPYGITVSVAHEQKPVYMDKNGRIITAMIEEYRAVTGDASEPKVIGGGTYARAMPGIVAFGPMQPGRECTEHQRDEYILIDDLFTAEEIYRRVIEKLANL